MSGNHAVSNAEKGARYLGLLDHALCDGNWSEITELARKVDKHAPQRTCLTLAARCEAQLASAYHRPTSASSTASSSIHSLSALVPKLSEAIASARSEYPDDVFVATTCIAEIQWLQQNPIAVLEILTTSTDPPANANSKPAPLGWLEVCTVKRAYIQASALDSCARQGEARECYQDAVTRTPGYRSPELRRWTERLLARACMYNVKKLPSPSLQDLGEAHNAFRAWGEFWQRAPTGATNLASHVDLSRRVVWKEYYDLLSYALQHGLLLQTGTFVSSDTPLSADQRSSAKLHLRSQMKRVETTYETLLLGETKFPMASQSNTEVEEWVEQVISNWKVFCGTSWTDIDLGEGRKQAVSRNVLDVLYRSATKTFHSTAILRQLFTVHASLGEFGLALHAFDSYVDIVDRGKARAEKTGKHELGFDDDDTAIMTAVDAVRILCRYGDREQAERANNVCKIIQRWLSRQRPTDADANELRADDTPDNGDDLHSRSTASMLAPATLGAAYRALGTSQAHWAHLTYESEARSSLLEQASHNLRQAQGFDSKSIDTAYALALVLAELRDLSGAMDVIKAALSFVSEDQRPGASIPLWHLLALCLTGEDAFEVAAQVCSNAIDLFDDTTSTVGSDLEKENSALRPSPMDALEGFEQEYLLQTKITQILLLELMDGPEEAVDYTSELLDLYGQLFGTPEAVAASITVKMLPTLASTTSPRTGGTLRSIAGSIRPKSSHSARSSIEKKVHQPGASTNTRTNAPVGVNGDALGPPISITVTNEDGVATEKSPGRLHLPHLPFRHHHHEKAEQTPTQGTISNGDKRASTTGPQQAVDRMMHNAAHDAWPSPAGHNDQTPEQDTRLPAPHPAFAPTPPEPRFSIAHERRYKVNVLVRVWLFITQLYVRAGNLEDAQYAFDEAAKLVELLEIDLAASEEGTSARRLYQKGWATGHSVDELWGDVWCTKAQLASARNLPFQSIADYEQALAYFPDHPASIIGLSDLLMDIYEEKMPAEPPQLPSQPLPSISGSLIDEARPTLTRPNSATTLPSRRPSVVAEKPRDVKKDPTPAELNRLAARDRAYMLLYNLTKLGPGMDNSEAWLTLARAHELSREIAKAKQALWWVVDLEENRPIRPWREAMVGGYTL